MLIALDPGHGGGNGKQGDPGATSPINIDRKDLLYTEEDDIAYDIALKTQSLLIVAGFPAFLTRRPNQFISLRERCELANKMKANIFVSIHINAAGSPQARGIETFSYRNSTKGSALRDVVHQKVMDAVDRDKWVNRGLKEAGFYVLKHTQMPAALIECGFVTNVHDEIRLNDPEVRQQFAKGIAQGVIQYMKEDNK